MEQTARHIIFHGRVQGVGFRYIACRVAAKYGVTGFVRNLPDGTVEALMQGSPNAIDLCLKEIKEHFEHYVREVTVNEVPVNPRYTEFRIAY
ncbi:MAG: acylphosphatase [Planctomycetes bacterium]|jgi:acylphosphatase|nr:acylphosphatase [Planctomycetota bacterium]